MNEFQLRLRNLLSENELSRLQLSKQLNISSTTINGYFNKNYYPKLNIAIKMAKFFSCSLDYLFGLSDENLKEYHNKNTFIENFNLIIKQNNLSIASAMASLKMSEYDCYRWKKGLVPKTINLIEIAKHFDCSLDFLVGRNWFLN